MTGHRLQDRSGQVVRIEATPEPIAIDTARTAVLVVDTQNDFGAQGDMFDRAGIDISMIQGAIGPTAGKKPTLTLDTVPYTANAHPLRGRDSASHRDDGRLDVKVSSAGAPGSGTTPEGNHAGPATLVRPRRRMMMSAVSSSLDDFLDDVTLYWLTNSATSAARLYWETSGQSVLLAAAQKTAEIALPVAIAVFPDEVYRAPETWARRAYRNLIYFHEVDKGGHFAAWEEPQLFSEEIRAAFRSLRP
jgi:pimeloyl-ACP methyl ester carboxylesterase